MNSSRRIIRLAILVLIGASLCAAQNHKEAQSLPQDDAANGDLPKNSACPNPLGQGQVRLSITVDANGNVSQANALSGPEELIAATVACAKTWRYKPPVSAPVTKIVSVSYQSRDCAPATSEHGEMQWSWALRDATGKVVANLGGGEPPAPPYPAEERKAGAAGRMVLAVSLNPEGYVKEVHAVRSLSAGLDKAVMDRLRPLKFTLRPDLNPQMASQGLYFLIVFHATCTSQTISTVESGK